MFAAALAEAVTHHALAEQKEDHGQDSCKQEMSHSDLGRLSSARDQCIHLRFSLRRF
jgi:hypothetical protein